MKTSRADNVYRRNIEYNRDYRTKRTIEFKTDYQLYSTNIQSPNKYDWSKDVGCQCNTRSNMIGYSAPRRAEVVYYSGLPKQMYAYTRARSYTNVGVGSVYQQKKRVRKIYLPETENRGVGSSDLSTLIADRKSRYERETCYHSRKKTSSKCVGGATENVRQCTEKLSPITISIYKNSKGTSPNEMQEAKTFRKDIGNNTVEKNVANTTTQVEKNEQGEQVSSKQINNTKTANEVEPIDTVKSARYPAKKYQGSSSMQKSSDSLEQHVHNLEDPSYIQSTGSSDPMENKLEKEYRKIFSNKNKEEKIITEKPMHDLKSTSLLRRRFEALKRGIAKKEDSKKNYTPPSKESGPVVQSSGTPIHRDISVESDPPSLEARSYSHTKIFSPPPSVYKYDRRSRYPRKKSHTSKKDKGGKDGPNLPPKDNKVDDADVKGMFKVWGEKFNFEEEKKVDPPGVSFETKPKALEIKTKVNEPKTEPEDKKEGKRFFFFKKKSKDKAKSPCEKKGVTTGRCEVKNCTVLNRHKEQHSDKYPQAETPKKVLVKSDEDDVIKKNWLKNFIQRTIESRKSLQIRWNNKTYTTSSSTVFELMDNMYRQANVVIRSHSETSTATSSYYQSYHKHRVNFVQDVEAWMIPKLIPHKNAPYNFFHRNDGNSRISDRKWFIDKSKAFAHEIELVLNSKNFVRCHRTISSDYLRIDIPKGFFTDLSSDSDKFATSNSEEVYKIIEYESPESRSEMRYNVRDNIGDYSHNDVRLRKRVSVRDKDTDTRVLETVIKKPPVHRDVVIQGSNVHIPKRCDVIGVGIITHRVNREIGKSLMNTEDDVSEDESEQLMESNIKQCQFAESYLRDYYRHWMPLGMDLFPERVSDFHIKCESQETLSSLHNQGDGTRSCPNISNDYHSNINLHPSSNSHGSCKDVYIDKTKIFNTFKSTTQSEAPLEPKRVLPKDSFEVLRKRMLYACGNRSRWNYPDDQPYSVPSIQDKAEQDALNDISKTPEKIRKNCRKRVSITDCDFPPESASAGKNADQKPVGILSYSKKSVTSLYTKRATVREDENCVILPPLCSDHCNSVPNPKCSQKSSSEKSSSTSASSKKNSSNNNSPKKKSPSKNNSPSKSKNNSPSKSKDNSPTKNNSPINNPIPFDETVPCKRNSPCRNNSERSVNEYQCPCPCTTKVAKKNPLNPQLGVSSSDESSTRPCICSPKPLKKLPQLPKTCPCPSKKSMKNKQEKKLQNPCSSSSSNNSKNSSNSHCRSCRGKKRNTKSLSPNPRTQSPCAQTPPKPKTPSKCEQFLKPNTNSPCKQLSSKPKQKPQSPCGQMPPIPKIPSKCGESCPNPRTRSPCACTECLKNECLNMPESHSQLSIESQVSDPLNSCPISTQTLPKVMPGMPDFPLPCAVTPCPDDLVKRMKSPAKLQGVHLKKKAAPRCSSDCPVTASEMKKKKGAMEMCGTPSEEQILIRVKKSTPSTEEIRENVNIRVQDADGKTLFERIDYKADCGIVTHKSSLLGEMYKVNRISTASVEKLTLKDNQKCAKSISNMIEISFGLKVTQGDKIAEINLSGVNEEADKVETKCNDGKSQDVFIINSKTEATHDDPDDKNDINIKIVIKNFDTKTGKPSRKHNTDDFAKKISQKFHTVSTGYSDVLGNRIDDMYSIHRTTIDLTDSKSQPLPNLRNDNEKEENPELIVNNLNSEEETLPKEAEIIGDVPMNDIKATNQKDNQSIQNSETYEVVNRSRQNIVDLRQSISNEKIQLNDVCPTLQKSKTGEGRKEENAEMSRNEESVDKKKQIKNSVSIKNSGIGELELKNTIILVPEETNSRSETVEHLHNNENLAVLGNNHENETCVTVQKSEIVLTSRAENDVLDKSLERKSESNIALYDKENLQNNSTIQIDVNDNTIKYGTSETKSEIKELSLDSKNHTTLGNQSYNNITNKVIESSEIVQSEISLITEFNTNTDKMVSDMLESILQHDKIVKYGGGELILDTGIHNDVSETMQSDENCKRIVSDEKVNNSEGLEQQKSECNEFPSLHKKCVPNETKDYRKVKKNIYDKQPPTMKSKRSTDLESENEHTDLDQSHKSLRFSHTDSDDPGNTIELTNTSDEAQDSNAAITKPYTKREKKEMLKHVFEKATNQKWKSKGRMKRLKNMLKFILTSDSSDVDEVAVTSKDLVKDITYSAFEQPSLIKETDSMNNYYRVENLLQSDDECNDEMKIPADEQEQSEYTSDTSDYQTNINKCLCHTMAERLRTHGEILTGGCCCKSPIKTVHEQTSCNINNERDLYMVNYKAAEYIDVQTQNSVINSKITNVMLVKKMESVMTSMKCSEYGRFKQNHSVSPFKDDKECEVKNVKTNTVLGLLDDGKIVIRTSDSKKSSLQTEIIIGWKGKDKKKQKESKKTCFSTPADILQSYETKKAVLEIYTEKTVTKEGEHLVAKLPKFVYDKEHEIEKNYVKNILLSHDRT